MSAQTNHPRRHPLDFPGSQVARYGLDIVEVYPSTWPSHVRYRQPNWPSDQLNGLALAKFMEPIGPVARELLDLVRR